MAETGMGSVMPIHWDDFFEPLSRPLSPSADRDSPMASLVPNGSCSCFRVRVVLGAGRIGQRADDWPVRRFC